MARWKSVSLIAILIATPLLVATCCVFAFQNRVGQAALGADAPLSELPPDATNVRWFLPGAFGPNTAYEFTTTEVNFRRWAKDVSPSGTTGPHLGEYTIMIWDQSANLAMDRNIEDAIAYEWWEGDQGVYMAYDRATGRAYYHSHSR